MGADDQARTWEDAALDALEKLRDISLHLRDRYGEEDTALAVCEQVLADMRSMANSPDDWNLKLLYKQMEIVGATAMTQVRMHIIPISTLLAEKHANYGTGNILAFGPTGLHVRMSDKVARLRNMVNNSRDSDEEPIADSWLDLVGYATIARMLLEGAFELPLERDL